MSKIANLVRYLSYGAAYVRAKVDPISYARSLGVRIGDDVKFYGMSPGMFGSEPWLVSIGSHVFITNGCQFVTHDGGTLVLRQFDPTLEWTAPISIGNHVYLGINTVVLPGVTIGDYSIVGAGSIVTKDLEGHAVYAGVPARRIKSLDEYLAEMKEKSLGFGAMSAREKAAALKQHFGIRDE